MRKFLWTITAAVAILTVAVVNIRLAWKCENPDTTTVVNKVDSIVYDTIPYMVPVPVDSTVIRYQKVKVPVTEKILIDSVVYDSVEVELPITQKEYQDSTYHAWVSGYMPHLDSIQVRQKTIYQTTTIHTKPKKWGLGVQAGMGVGKDGIVAPYIGVGIQYTIFSW